MKKLMDTVNALTTLMDTHSYSSVSPSQLKMISGRKFGKISLFGMAYGLRGNETQWTIFDDEYAALVDRVYIRGVHDTVATALSQVPGTRMTTDVDDDPLFEAMERHNNRIKAGKAALKTLFKAEPLPICHNHTTGPAKTKDWE